MAITWTNIQEGDGITATDLNSRFESIENEINDLQAEDIQLHSLGQPHLPSMIHTRHAVTIGGATSHTYNSSSLNYPNEDLANPAGPTYFDYNQDSSALGGWEIITDASGDQLRIEFDDDIDLTADGGLRGILVMANVNVRLAEDYFGSNAVTTIHPVFAIQALDNTLQSHTVRKSERFTSSELEKFVFQDGTGGISNPQSIWKDVAIRTFITQEGSIGGNLNFCGGIQVVVSIANQSSGTTLPTAEVTLGRANLSVIVFRAGGGNFG